MKNHVLLAVVTMSVIGLFGPRFARGADEAAPTLEFYIAESAPSAGLKAAKIEGSPDQVVYLRSKPVAGRADITDARAVLDVNDRPAIEIGFNAAGEKKIALATLENMGKKIAVVVDGKVICAPVIRDKISQRAQVTGAFSDDEVKQLVTRLQPRAKAP